MGCGFKDAAPPIGAATIIANGFPLSPGMSREALEEMMLAVLVVNVSSCAMPGEVESTTIVTKLKMMQIGFVMVYSNTATHSGVRFSFPLHLVFERGQLGRERKWTPRLPAASFKAQSDGLERNWVSVCFFSRMRKVDVAETSQWWTRNFGNTFLDNQASPFRIALTDRRGDVAEWLKAAVC